MRPAWRKLRFLIARSRRESELRDELAFHLDQETEDQREAGLPPLEARHAARRSLGNMGRVAEETRAAWGFSFLETLLQDVRIAVRDLRRNVGFSMAAIVILGLGIGASTAVFSVVNAVILKPLAFPHPDRVVALRSLWEKTGEHGPVSIPDFEDWRSGNSSFDSMAYYSGGETAIGVETSAQFARVTLASKDFFRVFEMAPALGRAFRAEETASGSGGAAIVSDSFWRARLGGSPAALGKTVRIAGHVLPIVGIMPAGFQFPDKTEIWIPSDTVFRIINPNRGGHNYFAVGRLKTGIRVRDAQAEMSVIGKRLERRYPGTNGEKNVAVTPLGEEMVRGVTTMLYLLLGAVLLLMLISSGNVANLLLAKAAGRTREMGVRAALGAGRGRIIRQLATESLVLGAASGLAGLAVANFGILALVSLAPATVPRLEATGIDHAVLAFATILTLFACVLFGLVPALRVAGADVSQALQQAGFRGPRGVRSGLRRAFVIIEIAFSVVLLTGAGLLIRSFSELSNTALGFETRQVLVMETTEPVPDLEGAQRVVRGYKTLLDQISGIPGVVAAGADRIPPGRVLSSGAYSVDQEAAAGKLSVESPQAAYSIVSPGVFAVLGIPVRAGRDFSAADGPSAPLTAIVNETLARKAFPGEDPLGHSILTGMDILKPMTIVGVVGDIRQRGPGEESMPEVYMPYEQHPLPSTALRILVKTSVPPEIVIEPLRQKAKQILPDMPVKFTTMEARMSENVAVPRFRTLLLAIFAAIAVALTMAGVYGVVSFLVTQRTQEIGLRIALGARAGQVLKSVLSQGAWMASIGLAVGVAGAAGAARFLSSMLFEVKPFDPSTYVAVAALTMLVTLGACFLPAWRASRIDPMTALRQE